MSYKLLYDDGVYKFEASNVAEAQIKARQFLMTNHLVPQRRKNYLYRYTFYKKTWNVSRAFWRWDEMPI